MEGRGMQVEIWLAGLKEVPKQKEQTGQLLL